MQNKAAVFLPTNRLALILAISIFLLAGSAWAENTRDTPMIINGDNVEYSPDNREVVATGNIEVIYHGSKLTCNRLKVNMLTKEALAEGNAKIEDSRGIVTGERIVYDFENKTGIIYSADFRANPYFGYARKVEKQGDTAFVSKNGYFTTCNLDHPHFKFASKKITIFPKDKIQAQKTTFYLWRIPLFYLPRFNYSMKEPIMHVQVQPGKRKDWGPYILSAWRYNLTQNSNLRLLLDYRTKLGIGEGFDLNYKSPGTGKGDLKFYFANEKFHNPPAGAPTEFQRYLLRWRHRWIIDPATSLIAEFYKISDKRWKYENSPAPNLNAHTILQDYFFREYERDSQPLTYALFHHAFNYSSLDIIMQKRTNHWFDHLNKLPEARYDLPSIQLGASPLYFENSTLFGVYNKKASMAPVTLDDVTSTRLDTINTLALPMRLSIFRVKPFVASRQTYYDKGANGQSGIVRTIFYSGTDVSTKFFKIYNVKTNFMGMEINGLRHIITPGIKYLYTHAPTIPASNIRQIDTIDAITRGNTATLSLSNKWQTKRKGQSVDFVDFLITTDYVLDPKSGTGQNAILNNPGSKLESQLADILFKLKVLPYSWMRMESEVTFEHSDRTNPNYNRFSIVNYSLGFDLGKERGFSIGQRYNRKSYNEVTAAFTWRFTPKWKFMMYQRYNLKSTATLGKGYQEQEYKLTRDLHCWEVDFVLNKKEDTGTTIFVTFRLKAFPENEFGFDQKMSEKKSGSQ